MCLQPAYPGADATGKNTQNGCCYANMPPGSPLDKSLSTSGTVIANNLVIPPTYGSSPISTSVWQANVEDMRILHTSDWHLGRNLHGVDLHDAQKQILGEIKNILTDPPDKIPIEAVLIAGDIFDRAIAPAASIKLFEETLCEFSRIAPVIVSSGNHDSAIRLGFGSGLFREDVHMRTDINEISQPVIIADTAIYAIPYLDPGTVHADLSAATNTEVKRSHEDVMRAAMRLINADWEQRKNSENLQNSIIMAHAFVTGSGTAPATAQLAAPQTSDSEQRLLVGGVETISAAVFAGHTYIALGHLHGPSQPQLPLHTLAYSGSLLRYSFSEENHQKGVLLVDIAAGKAKITRHLLTQPRDMATLRGSLHEILTDAKHALHEQSWVRIAITDRVRPNNLVTKIKSRYPHALIVTHEPPRAEHSPTTSTASREDDPRELAEDFLTFATGSKPSAAEIAVFSAAFEQVKP